MRFDDISRYCRPSKMKEEVKIRQVSVGINHYAMVDYSGYLWVCGDNNNGCLGVGDSNKRT